jgi:hypothetical protein
MVLLELKQPLTIKLLVSRYTKRSIKIMKVFIVYWAYYDDWEILKAFDTEGKARKEVELSKLTVADDMKRCYNYTELELE